MDTARQAPAAAHGERDMPAATWTRIGMIVPSSNTVLEPLTAALLAPYEGAVTAHFARMKVVEISLSDRSREQFTGGPVVAAAAQLADARCDVIAWNGTSASWLGLAADEALAAAVTAETGIAATTTTLAFFEAFRVLGVTRLGLVTPYVREVQDGIVANYRAHGVEVVAERGLDDKENFAFAEYSPGLVARLVREVAEARPDAIAIVCTNFRGGTHAAALEDELGIPILDSVAVTLWGTLRKAGIPTAPLTREGRLFGAGETGC